jgi:TonB family protein
MQCAATLRRRENHDAERRATLLRTIEFDLSRLVLDPPFRTVRFLVPNSISPYFASTVVHLSVLATLSLWSEPMNARFQFDSNSCSEPIVVTASIVEPSPMIDVILPSPILLQDQVIEAVDLNVPSFSTNQGSIEEIVNLIPSKLIPAMSDGDPPGKTPDEATGDDRVHADFSKNAPPPYPLEGILRRLEGVVMLRLSVNAKGDVVDLEVISSSGHKVLDEAASQSVIKWKGIPAKRFNHPVPSEEILPIRFRL